VAEAVRKVAFELGEVQPKASRFELGEAQPKASRADK
jgi:hypothetical protein